MDLRLGDCLEILKDIPDKYVDLVFADLPYGQVNCKWDCKIDLELLWIELLRIAKSPATPFFFTCTTKFGYELISSNKKMFKYDLVWAKSNPCGFLQAKKQPMRKHEMLYVFYKKQPAYDISSHKHKFLKEETKITTPDEQVELCYGNAANYGKKHYKSSERKEAVYDPPLPTSVIKEEVELCKIKENGTYTKSYIKTKKKEDHSIKYDPPLPTSVIKEDNCYNKGGKAHYEDYKTKLGYGNRKDSSSAYDPPLPTSVIKEEDNYSYGKNGSGGDYTKDYAKDKKYNKNQVLYDPPLPTSVLKEDVVNEKINEKQNTLYGKEIKTADYVKMESRKKIRQETGDSVYEPPLPTSVLKEDVYGQTCDMKNKYEEEFGMNKKERKEVRYDPPLPTSVIKEDTKLKEDGKEGTYPHDTKYRYDHMKKNGVPKPQQLYEPPLPTSVLEIKSIRLKQHSTAKPPDLMKWILKYYSKEGDVILDPTMGSNPMGLACKDMNRDFIGIEKDPEIYEFACSRVDY